MRRSTHDKATCAGASSDAPPADVLARDHPGEETTASASARALRDAEVAYRVAWRAMQSMPYLSDHWCEAVRLYARAAACLDRLSPTTALAAYARAKRDFGPVRDYLAREPAPPILPDDPWHEGG